MENGREVVARHGDSEKVLRNRRLSEAIRKGRMLSRSLRETEALLMRQKAVISRHAGRILANGLAKGLDRKGTITFIAGLTSCKVALRHEALIPPGNVEAVRKALNGRFDDLVRLHERYACSERLIREIEGNETLMGLIEMKELCPRMSWQTGRPGGKR